jgi:hypothetical protein
VAEGQAPIVKRSKIVGSRATRGDINELISGAKPSPKPRLPLLFAVASDSASFVNSESDCVIEGMVGEALPLIFEKRALGYRAPPPCPQSRSLSCKQILLLSQLLMCK